LDIITKIGLKKMNKIKVELSREIAQRLKEKRHGMINTYDLVILELLDKDE